MELQGRAAGCFLENKPPRGAASCPARTHQVQPLKGPKGLQISTEAIENSCLR